MRLFWRVDFRRGRRARRSRGVGARVYMSEERDLTSPRRRPAGSYCSTAEIRAGGKSLEPRNEEPGGVDEVHVGSLERRARSLISWT